MRVVLDTNVVMSGMFFGGPPGRILTAWRSGEITLSASPEIVEEYVATADVLMARYHTIELEPLVALIVNNAEITQCPPLLKQVCADPDDDKFLACALASNSECVISGDKALQRVSGYRGIAVMSPRQFVDMRLAGR